MKDNRVKRLLERHERGKWNDKFPRSVLKDKNVSTPNECNAVLRVTNYDLKRYCHRAQVKYSAVRGLIKKFVGKPYLSFLAAYNRNIKDIPRGRVDLGFSRNDLVYYGYCLDESDLIQRKPQRKANPTKPIVIKHGKDKFRYTLNKELLQKCPAIVGILRQYLSKDYFNLIFTQPVERPTLCQISFMLRWKAKSALEDILGGGWWRWHNNDVVEYLFKAEDITDKTVYYPNTREFIRYHKEEQRKRKKEHRNLKRFRKEKGTEIFNAAIERARQLDSLRKKKK